jgi:hypothetical protein
MYARILSEVQMLKVSETVGAVVGTFGGIVLSAGVFEIFSQPCGVSTQGMSMSARQVPQCFPTGQSLSDFWLSSGSAITAMLAGVGWMIGRSGVLDGLLFGGGHTRR